MKKHTKIPPKVDLQKAKFSGGQLLKRQAVYPLETFSFIKITLTVRIEVEAILNPEQYTDGFLSHLEHSTDTQRNNLDETAFCVCLFSPTYLFLTDRWMGWLYLIHWQCKALSSLTAIINGFERWNKCCSMVHWAEWRAVPSPVSLRMIYLMSATLCLDQKCF